VGLFRRDRSDWPQGRATVLDERGTHPVQLDLDVLVPPAASFRTTVAVEAPPGYAGNLRGRALPVRVHPRKHDKLEILWSQAGVAAPAVQTASSAPVATTETVVEVNGRQVQLPPGGQQDLAAQLRQLGVELPPLAAKAINAFGGFASKGIDLSQLSGIPNVTVVNSHEQVGDDAIDGRATVTAFQQTPMQINELTLVTVGLNVQLPGREPYDVTHRTMAPTAELSRLQPGASIPVRVSSKDQEQLVLVFS
jgi:hypothetical protein